MRLRGRPLLEISGWGNTGQRGHNQRRRNYHEEAGVPGEAEVHIGVAGLGGPDLWFASLESLRYGGSPVWSCPRDANSRQPNLDTAVQIDPRGDDSGSLSRSGGDSRRLRWQRHGTPTRCRLERKGEGDTAGHKIRV
ncbi:hypothetical protein M6B38_118735 [Iris pallida]|uniref:Uncharacterized protein n=1 Tax=Iris pallida TaxID=29817 RepID=A0AAX6HJA5_IRIPA|nr:hypothetical protein M6B38_118735 [Iris pallida]